MSMQQRALIAGLMGMFGGMGDPVTQGETPRPTVDDVWKRASMPSTRRHRFGKLPLMGVREKKKHRWKIAKMSRKKNYARNGTRG